MDSSKKRLTLTIASMCIALVSVVVSVVAIFAATRQGVQSTFKVSYVAKNVAATVSAEYTVLNEETKTLGAGSLVIDAAADQTVYEDLSTTDEIELTAENYEVVFKYTFQNNSESRAFTVKILDNVSKHNVGVQYAYADSQATADLTYSGVLNTAGTTDDEKKTITVEGNKTVNIYIKVTITNKANDAYYESKENNYLSWDLNAVIPA